MDLSVSRGQASRPWRDAAGMEARARAAAAVSGAPARYLGMRDGRDLSRLPALVCDNEDQDAFTVLSGAPSGLVGRGRYAPVADGWMDEWNRRRMAYIGLGIDRSSSVDDLAACSPGGRRSDA